jgi:hypothetical protein
MIATRLPVRSWEWSHRAVCIVTPANPSTPSMSGSFGTVSTPLALTRNRAVRVLPSSNSTRQQSDPSSKDAAATVVPKRILPRRPYRSTHRSAYRFSSAPLA